MQGDFLNLIAIDCETGGLLPEHSLLTAAIVKAELKNKKLIFGDFLDLKLKPEDGNYFINPEALEVNGINLVRHNEEAIPYHEGGKLIHEFLSKDTRQVIVGHKVQGDVDAIIRNCIGHDTFYQNVNYNVIDTLSIANHLKALGHIPQYQKLKLVELAKFFKIPVAEKKLHTAYYDAYLNLLVYEAMLKF
jgi:DNA polymerase-3 subunit epsilon/ribonuclease T